MADSNIDKSGNLKKSLEQRGFPKDWLNRSELHQHWIPLFETILQNVSTNQAYHDFCRDKNWRNEYIESLGKAIPKLESEIETNELGKEIGKIKKEELNKQTRDLKRLQHHQQSESQKYEEEYRNYEELMNAKKTLEDRGFKFDI